MRMQLELLGTSVFYETYRTGRFALVHAYPIGRRYFSPICHFSGAGETYAVLPAPLLAGSTKTEHLSCTVATQAI